MYEEKMGRAKLQKLPCGQEMLEPDGTVELKPELASLYISFIGWMWDLFLARRVLHHQGVGFNDVMPTTGSLRKLGELIGHRQAENGSEDENMEGEEMATICLDSGEIVQVPLAYVEPREPESEDEGPAAPDMPMQETTEPQQVEWAYEDMPTPTPQAEDPRTSQATSSWISSDEMKALAEYDKPGARSGLRAKQHSS